MKNVVPQTPQLPWRHNDRDGFSYHRRLDCLLSPLFGRRSKKTIKLRVTRLCEGKQPMTDGFPSQMASKAENESIWWRHHVSIHQNRWFNQSNTKGGKPMLIFYGVYVACESPASICTQQPLWISGTETLESVCDLVLHLPHTINTLVEPGSHSNIKTIFPGPIFCLLLGVSSGCVRPITGQVTSVTWPVIGWALPELTPSKIQKTGRGLVTSIIEKIWSWDCLFFIMEIPTVKTALYIENDFLFCNRHIVAGLWLKRSVFLRWCFHVNYLTKNITSCFKCRWTLFGGVHCNWELALVQEQSSPWCWTRKEHGLGYISMAWCKTAVTLVR